MKILFDFRAYQEFYPRGVSRYVYELFTNVFLKNKEKNYILLDRDKLLPQFDKEISENIVLYSLEDFKTGKVEETFDFFVNGSTTWLGLQRYISLDILYPKEVLEVCRKKVCILYDFVPLLYPHYLPGIRDQVNYSLQCEAMKYMDHIFTISQYISKSGERYLNRPAKDFTCLYGGADVEKFHTPNSDAEYDAKKRTNNLVNISGICVRKNYLGVTTAFCKAYLSKKLPDDAKLIIICGAVESFINEIKEETEKCGLKYGKQVVATGYISDKEMIGLLSTARCSIYPSFYEGLGLPILESYTAGTPCIASNTASMKELTLSNASFDPFDTNDISKKIIEVYSNEKLCKESLTFGRKLIKDINWTRSAEIFMERLESLNK